MMWLRFFRQVLGTRLLVHDHDGKRRVEVAPERSIHAKRGVLLLALAANRIGRESLRVSLLCAAAISCLAFALFTLAC